jgi:hypothetical protein
MSKRWLPVVIVGLALAVVVALFSPLASSQPDGLERVAEDEEFIHEAKDPPYEIIADYVFPGIENESLATVLSGLVGIAIVAVVCFGLVYGMRMLSGKRDSDSSATGTSGRS